MFFPTLIVFPQDDALVAQTIYALKSYGFECFVDTKNKTNLEWLNNNNKAPHRFYVFVDGEIVPVEHLLSVPPFLLISFQHDDAISDQDWELINQFIDGVVYKKCPKIQNRLKELLNPPTVQKSDGALDEANNGYYFDKQEDKECTYFQFTKPFVDAPYTLAMYDFVERGYLPVFAALIGHSNWGFSDLDYAFLKKVWTHLNCKGQFDPDQIMADYAKQSMPSDIGGGYADLIVARMTIDEMKEMQMQKRRGVYLGSSKVDL